MMDRFKVKYSRIPIEPPQQETAFDYGSAFDPKSSHFKSIYTYSSELIEEKEEEATRETWPSFLCRVLIVFLGYVFVISTFPISYWFAVKKLTLHQQLVIFRLGLIKSARGPCRVLVLPFIDSWRKVDVRTRAFSIPPQQVIICGGAVVEVGAEVQYQIVDVRKSVSKVKDLDSSTRLLARTIFVNRLCKSTLEDLQLHKNDLVVSLQTQINKCTTRWGLNVSRIEMSQLKVHKQPDDAAQPVISAIQGIFGGAQANSSAGATQVPPVSSRACSSLGTANYYLALVSQHLDSIADFGTSNTSAIYELDIIDNDSSTEIFVVVDNGSGHVTLKNNLSVDMKADVTVTMQGKDLEDMLAGSLSPLQAYIGGNIKVSGNVQMLMLFQDILNKPKKSKSVVDV